MIMASFEAKTWRDRLRIREKKIIVLIHLNPTRNREFLKKSKKIQKIKKHHYCFFSGQNRAGVAVKEREKKFSFQSVPTRLEIWNSKKKSQIIQKIKKHYYGFFSSQTEIGPVENEIKKKITIPIHSNPTQDREFQQNCKKLKKKN